MMPSVLESDRERCFAATPYGEAYAVNADLDLLQLGDVRDVDQDMRILDIPVIDAD